MLDIACRFFPAELPFFLPWEFSWPEYLATVLLLFWFWRGWNRVSERPAKWRAACFLLGVLSFYIVLQTHIDFLAQHMFFVHRAAHFVLHHAGAFFIALGMAGPVIAPACRIFSGRCSMRSRCGARSTFFSTPAVAPILFVGLLYFWLIPSIHTRVMLDANLYALMNWTRRSMA